MGVKRKNMETELLIFNIVLSVGIGIGIYTRLVVIKYEIMLLRHNSKILTDVCAILFFVLLLLRIWLM